MSKDGEWKIPNVIVYPVALGIILGEYAVIGLESLTSFLPFRLPTIGTVLRTIGLKK
jgi:hypothetical protein